MDDQTDSKTTNSKNKLAIEDFETIEDLGEGSFGRVTLMRLKSNSKIFAVKCINKAFMFKQKKEHHIFQERLLLSSIRSQKVVRLYSAFQDNISLYFMLEYLENGTLAHYLQYKSWIIRKIVR